MCLGIPAQIVGLVPEAADLAAIDMLGTRRVVNVGLLDGVAPGDWVLVHVGFALTRLEHAEAQATLAMLDTTRQMLDGAESMLDPHTQLGDQPVSG